MHQTLYEWIETFGQIVDTEGPTRIANSLVQLGIDTQESCYCVKMINDPPATTPEMEAIDEVTRSHHENHRLFNTLVWNILKDAGKIGSVRRALREDLKVPTTDGYGHIVQHSYGRLLLDNFLRASPNDQWVKSEDTHE